MTPGERKAEFRAQADRDGKTLNAAAYEVCGITWYHLAEALKNKRPLGAEVKAKFAAYIGRTVDDVFAAVTGGVASIDESCYTVEAVERVGETVKDSIDDRGDVLGGHAA